MKYYLAILNRKNDYSDTKVHYIVLLNDARQLNFVVNSFWLSGQVYVVINSSFFPIRNSCFII